MNEYRRLQRNNPEQKNKRKTFKEITNNVSDKMFRHMFQMEKNPFGNCVK